MELLGGTGARDQGVEISSELLVRPVHGRGFLRHHGRPPGPALEELAAQAARQQEELNLKQMREQMGQYRYLGYLNQQGVQKGFVGKGKDIYIIRKGDKLDGKFLVASVDPTIVKLKEPATNIEASIELKKEGDLGPS